MNTTNVMHLYPLMSLYNTFIGSLTNGTVTKQFGMSNFSKIVVLAPEKLNEKSVKGQSLSEYSVIQIKPENPLDMLKLYCDRCQKSTGYPTDKKENKENKFYCKVCKNPKNELTPIFEAVVVVQEDSKSKKTINLSVNTADTETVNY